MFVVGIVGFVLFVIALNWFVCLILFCMLGGLGCVSYDLFVGLVAVLDCFVGGFLFGWVVSLLWLVWVIVWLGDMVVCFFGYGFIIWLLIAGFEWNWCLFRCYSLLVSCCVLLIGIKFLVVIYIYVCGLCDVLLVGFELGLISLCLLVDACCLFWFCFALADFYLCVLIVLVVLFTWC